MLKKDAGDIHIRIERKVGRITLNRPESLNALTYEMVPAIKAILSHWLENEQIQLVMIDANSEKSFCAGGDIRRLYHSGIEGAYDDMRCFWAEQYALNALIAHYPKPYVAFMDGIVMGGGVGVSSHGSCRIVTRQTQLAMPECAIGLTPDVGGSFLLARAPGRIGEYMGLTGARLNAEDAIYAGFADILVERENIAELKADLIANGDVQNVAKYAGLLQSSALCQRADLIESFFAVDSAIVALHALENDHSDWARAQAKHIRQACPLSIACTWKIIKNARLYDSVEQALLQEYRFVWRSMEKGDFLEGVRALIIDKDRKPTWKVKRLEDVTDGMVSSMLISLGENELRLSQTHEQNQNFKEG